MEMQPGMICIERIGMIRPCGLVRAAPPQLSFRPTEGRYWTSIGSRCWTPINTATMQVSTDPRIRIRIYLIIINGTLAKFWELHAKVRKWRTEIGKCRAGSGYDWICRRDRHGILHHQRTFVYNHRKSRSKHISCALSNVIPKILTTDASTCTQIDN